MTGVVVCCARADSVSSAIRRYTAGGALDRDAFSLGDRVDAIIVGGRQLEM
jgi:hypothetical protein